MLLVTVARAGMQEPLRAIPQPSTSAKSTREQSQGLGQTHLPHSGPQPSAAALPSRLRCPSRPPSPPAGDSGHWSGPETHPAVPRSGEGEDPCSDNLQPLTGPQPPDSLPRPHTSLTRSLWVLRSSCRKSRRAPRTASGSRSGDVGELAGPGDGGSDPELRSKGLGLLGPSPLPGGGDLLRDAGAMASPAGMVPAGSRHISPNPATPSSPHEPAAQTGSPRPPVSPFTSPQLSPTSMPSRRGPDAHPQYEPLTLYKLATPHHPQLHVPEYSLFQH